MCTSVACCKNLSCHDCLNLWFTCDSCNRDYRREFANEIYDRADKTTFIWLFCTDCNINYKKYRSDLNAKLV